MRIEGDTERSGPVVVLVLCLDWFGMRIERDTERFGDALFAI
jgi:hypothetical protein